MRPIVAVTCLSLLLLSLAPVSPAAADPVATDLVLGTGLTLASPIYGTDRTLCVYLPVDYRESEAAYPVLYVVDGGFRQDFVPMAGLAALAWLSGQYRPFIVVGVQTEDRYHELTAPSTVPTDLEAIPACGGAAVFRRHLLAEVKPYVTAHYRTSGEDAIIGESLAGLFITETFLRAPTAFTHFIAVSPSLWWRDAGLSHEAGDLLQAPGFPADRSFYLTVADEGGTMLEAVERVAAALAAHAPAGLQWRYDPLPAEAHNTIYQPAALRALRWVFALPPAADH